MTKKKDEKEKKDIIDSIGPKESPELTESGRPIASLRAAPPEIHVSYADLVRVAMDRQGMTQVQLGINDPFERDAGLITDFIYLSPRAMAILLRLLLKNYKELIASSPGLAEELSMPPLHKLLD
jgi:hypothetical protein